MENSIASANNSAGKINKTEISSLDPSFVSNPSIRKDTLEIQSQQTSDQSRQLNRASSSDQFDLDSGTNKKTGKKSKGRKGAISNSEAASGGCCFGLFGGSSSKKKNKPILPEVKEETE